MIRNTASFNISPASNVLVVAAHPDDEALGCGGTIVQHTSQGAEVRVLFLADGETSRPTGQPLRNPDLILSRQGSAVRAAEIMGCQLPVFAGLRDNRLDSYDLLDIVQIVEAQVISFQPKIVYTHFANDLNIDHRITYMATMTACRPLPSTCVKLVASFETLSSTEWAPTGTGNAFRPSMFVDISGHLDTKLTALRCYDREMRPAPHSRSYEAVAALARLRGGTTGVAAAEAYQVERLLF